MKKTFYTEPTIDIEDVEVENGIANSPYGEEGMPGQDPGDFNDPDWDL